jgi:hypothetical protein
VIAVVSLLMQNLGFVTDANRGVKEFKRKLLAAINTRLGSY